MIEGLKVTVSGTELKQLALARAKFHAEKAATLKGQLSTLDSLDMTGKSMDPAREARDKIENCNRQAAELQFIAEHLTDGETYLLESSDLVKLGITYTRYF